ncbi:hypothetical protein [Ralstonia mannitolilytica]|jgi:hypothetical protein|uniref:hypothetical protein n=1 Tax=Ralstonia mannitolilytica TaxID=105219 RepID=UPI001425B18A|nr:hypothetical protein [Ralstonia mannitolilytica]MBY4719444.1 hypothetical protein [Ralstonia mannitolilytica]
MTVDMVVIPDSEESCVERRSASSSRGSVLGLAGLAPNATRGPHGRLERVQWARSGWQTQNAYYGMERSPALIFWVGTLGKALQIVR